MSWQPWRSDESWRGGRGQSRDRPYGGKGYGGGGYAGGGSQAGGYSQYEGGGSGPEERPWQDPARGKGVWDAGRAKGASKGAERVTVSEALCRIRAAVEEQRQLAQVAAMFGPTATSPMQWSPDSQQMWSMASGGMSLLGPSEPPVHAPPPRLRERREAHLPRGQAVAARGRLGRRGRGPVSGRRGWTRGAQRHRRGPASASGPRPRA